MSFRHPQDLRRVVQEPNICLEQALRQEDRSERLKRRIVIPDCRATRRVIGISSITGHGPNLPAGVFIDAATNGVQFTS